MTFLQYFIVFLIFYLCVYALIDRICKCIEYCTEMKAHSNRQEETKYGSSRKETRSEE